MHNRLIIVGNHIGHYLDIPRRTINLIKQHKFIVCESKHSLSLLLQNNNIDISSKIIMYYDFKDEENFINKIINIIQEQSDVVFIVDNGMPGFADTGLRLVNECHLQKILVDIVPGPSIVSTLPAIAGISNDTRLITFQEFFNEDKEKINQKLIQIKDLDHLLVMLHRATETSDFLQQVNNIFKDNRYAAVCINVGLPDQKIIRGDMKDLIESTKFLRQQKGVIASTVCSSPRASYRI